MKQDNVIVCFLLSSIEVRLISVTKLALQVTYNGLTIWYANYHTFAKRQILVLSVKQLLPVLFCLKLLKSISKLFQVLKAEMKKCVLRIAAIDLRKGSKNTSYIKTSTEISPI